MFNQSVAAFHREEERSDFTQYEHHRRHRKTPISPFHSSPRVEVLPEEDMLITNIKRNDTEKRNVPFAYSTTTTAINRRPTTPTRPHSFHRIFRLRV